MKKLMMVAVMAICCLTANAQKTRHDAGKITIQPMIGLSNGTIRGEYKTSSGTVKYDNDDPRYGLAFGAEGECYFDNGWFSLSAGCWELDGLTGRREYRDGWDVIEGLGEFRRVGYSG